MAGKAVRLQRLIRAAGIHVEDFYEANGDRSRPEGSFGGA
jgi:hypothetical protein